MTSHVAVNTRGEKMPLTINTLSLLGRFLNQMKYFMAIATNSIIVPTINGIQKSAKKVILEVSKFTFD